MKTTYESMVASAEAEERLAVAYADLAGMYSRASKACKEAASEYRAAAQLLSVGQAGEPAAEGPGGGN